jgi:hypothetical protein
VSCPSLKRAYRTKRLAILALEGIRLKRRENPFREERAPYRCPLCGEWHLTSHELRVAPRRHARSRLVLTT